MTDGGAWGAYGLALSSSIANTQGLRRLTRTYGRLEVECVQSEQRKSFSLSESEAVVDLADGSQLVMNHLGPAHFSAVLRRAAPISPEELLHPYLAPMAALCHRWMGRPALHAAAVTRAGTTLVLVAAREQGKTTTAAALSRLGWHLLADDLVVFDGPRVLEGPRTLDLRPASSHLVVSDGTLVRGGRIREVPDVADLPESRLGAFLHLEFGDMFSAATLDIASRLELLGPQLYWPGLNDARRDLLDLVAMPHWKICRPKGRPGLDAVLAWVEAEATNLQSIPGFL